MRKGVERISAPFLCLGKALNAGDAKDAEDSHAPPASSAFKSLPDYFWDSASMLSANAKSFDVMPPAECVDSEKLTFV